jgi:hypothetical protein
VSSGATFDLYAMAFAATCGFITLLVMWFAERVDDLPYDDLDCPDEIDVPSHIQFPVDAPIDWKHKHEWVD